ncbi:MAG: hypothetical protein WAW61_19760, partial [Methylococcaceae bacterium]
ENLYLSKACMVCASNPPYGSDEESISSRLMGFVLHPILHITAILSFLLTLKNPNTVTVDA